MMSVHQQSTNTGKNSVKGEISSDLI